jgi:protein-disulfide isomerase
VTRFIADRRGLIAAVLSLGLLAGGARAQLAPVPDEMVLGNPRARVTVVEYASLGCPHCGVWAREVFPAFKKSYIDTGKVRFVFKEMLFGNSTLAAAGFMVARCAGPANYFGVVDAVFADQAQIENGGADELLRVSKPFGITKDRFESCLKDADALRALQARTSRYATDDKITGTPTFLVGDKRLEGEQSLAQLADAIAAAKPTQHPTHR